MSTTASVSGSEVERIANLTDPVLRNLQITQCYHELSRVLAERTGGGANWCTYATWASKQAGQTIRKEDLARALQRSLEAESAAIQASRDVQASVQRVGLQLGIAEILDLLWNAYDPRTAFERSSAAVARGNLKVFAEIALEFARFSADCLTDPVYDAQRIAGFIEQLRPGDPPDGQQFLRRAFQHYYLAFFEDDPKARTELLLLANLEIGYHEQIRLQSDINEALVAPVITPQAFTRNLLQVLLPNAGWSAMIGWFILRVLGRLADFDRAVEVYVAGAQRQAQFLVTKALMTIDLASTARLRLGDDLSAAFPPILLHLSNPDLLALLAQIDPTPDSTRESGTEFWGDFPDRIHFIADMFRCYALTDELLGPPFSEDQIAAFRQGRIPAGRL
jgi:hypothetical protein